jgi:hypothetical protein
LSGTYSHVRVAFARIRAKRVRAAFLRPLN